MKSTSACVCVLAMQIAWLWVGAAYGTDLRFDVSTTDNSVLLPNLAFPSANGHIDLLGGSSYESLLNSKGNTLGIYFNNFSNGAFGNYPDPHKMAESIQSYVNTYWSSGQNGWIALNEISPSSWNSDKTETYTDANNNQVTIAYHTWCADVVALLKNGDSSDPSHIIPAHTGVIIFAPFANPTSNASDWQAIAQNAVIGDECYIDGTSVQADHYSVPALEAFYGKSLSSWEKMGVPASDLLLTSQFGVTTDSGYGANGLSGEAWQAAIECRDLAIYNTGFGAFCGYNWGKNQQNADDATRISYENAYAATMVLQTETPCWTGNDSSITGNSWANYLNWTGGLPSTTQFPYDALLNNPYNEGVIQHQTAANFLGNANTSPSGTSITLDGNQSITTMTFDSANSYTIAPGTGGTLTLTGAGPSITVTFGSHFITAGVVLDNDLSANLTGDLSLSGGITTNGHILTKSGTGTLIISGFQSHSSGSAVNVTGGTLNLNSDAGSSAAPVLTLSATGGSINLNTRQHLASLNLNGGNASVQTDHDHVLTDALTISNGSTFDLSNNDMIINYTGPSPFNQIDADLASGCNDGKWNGTGIASSAAAQKTVHDTALAVDEASHLFGLTGSNTAHFDGETIDSTTIIVKYTWVGDLNMDGIVNTTDRNLMSPDGTTNATWAMGDFNYDGIVNADDLALWQFAYVESGGRMIPEPTALTMLAGGTLLCSFRRRNH